MKKQLTIFFSTALFILCAQHVVAVEKLSAKELASHCEAFPTDPESTDGQYCIRYVQGFVDGAVATDVRVMMNIEAEADRELTFTERAMRTRLPSRADSDRAAKYAEFCLGDPVPLAEVVANVVNDLRRELESGEFSNTARDAVYDSLRTNYPCEEDQ